MDFDLTEEQQATAEVAAKLLADKATPDAIRAVEDGDDLRVDRVLWSALADAGLLGIAVPEAHGGAGLGVLEVCLVLEEVGRRTAPVPALAALAFAGLPIVRFGSPDQQAAILPGLAAGTTIPTAALVEPHGDPWRPSSTARPQNGGWVLDGTKTNVLAGMAADVVLVPASTSDGATGVFAVDPNAPGVTRERQETTSGIPDALITLDGVGLDAGAALGPVDRNGTVLPWILEHSSAAPSPLSRPSASELPTLTSTATPSASPCCRQRGAFLPASPPTARWRWPSTGPRPAASVSCTPHSICTGG